MELLAFYFHFPAWDTELFLRLNALHTPFWDTVAGQWTLWRTWIPLYVWMGCAVVRRYGRASWLPLLMVALCLYVGETLGDDVLKPLFLRLRPGRTPQLVGLVHLVHGPGGRYSFVSLHAITSFSMALCMQRMLKGASLLKACLWCWACLMSYSRIYIGKHFPLDLLGGALTGVLVAGLFCLLHRLLYPLVAQKKQEGNA